VALACATDPECQAMGACAMQAQPLDRNYTCMEEHEAGGTAYGALFGVLTSTCSNDCPVGAQWWCVGHAVPPSPPNSDTTMRVKIVDYLTNNPVPGVDISACAESDPLCDAGVLSSDTTTSDGWATVTIRPTGIGTATGYLTASKGGMFPELFFWGFQLTEPSVSERLSAFTPAEVYQIASLIGQVDVTTKALVVVIVTDCDDAYARDVQLSISASDPDGGIRIYYLQGGAISTTADSTDSTGYAVIVNVPAPAFITVKATPKALGQPSGVVQALTRPGTGTVVLLPANQ
jgi:hypothetical protein